MSISLKLLLEQTRRNGPFAATNLQGTFTVGTLGCMIRFQGMSFAWNLLAKVRLSSEDQEAVLSLHKTSISAEPGLALPCVTVRVL